MRKGFILFLLLPILGFAMGERPNPETLVSAQIVDKTGVKHSVSAFVCDDRSYLTLKEGSARLKVPFDKIRKISVLGSEGENLKVEVEFIDGRRKKFLIEGDIECGGAEKFGLLEIYLSQVKEIIFESR